MFICADIIEIEKIDNFFKESEGAKGDDVVHVSLPYGRILEICHEKNMVPRDRWFFSWLIHCNEEEFVSGLFSETNGIIDVACTNTFSEEIFVGYAFRKNDPTGYARRVYPCRSEERNDS